MESIWSQRLGRFRRSIVVAGGLSVATAIALTAASTGKADEDESKGNFSKFKPLPASAACTVPGGNPEQPFVLPKDYNQDVFAAEPQFPDLPDMNTVNETGPQAGRYIYRPHETSSNGAVSVTDLKTKDPKKTWILAQRADWERLDGIVWTPWKTILTAEETDIAKLRDPEVPQAVAGLVYEIDPKTGKAVPRPAVGSRSHEGLRFDSKGNLYGISETNRQANSKYQEGPGGFIYKFVPDKKGDLSSGQLYALKITKDAGDRTGGAEWIPLDREAVKVDSDAAAAAAGATGYDRPEDVEIATSTGGGPAYIMYVAITGEDRVLGIDLMNYKNQAYVYDFVKAGMNAPAGDFDSPDNLALDKAGNLFITEDPGGKYPAKTKGDDIWTAMYQGGKHKPAESVQRFASLTDCDAEPTGVYFSLDGKTLYVNVQHRGGDTRDLAVAITKQRGYEEDDDRYENDEDHEKGGKSYGEKNDD